MLAFYSLVSANTYFVAPNGLDSNPGTIDKPWKTWGKGFTSASPGDIVYFRGGVYPMSVAGGAGYTSINDGTLGDTIYYWAYPDDFKAGNKPILDCGAIVPSANLNWGIKASTSYCYFKGLTIRNVFQRDGEDECRAWRVQGSNTIIENCTAYNIHGPGFWVQAANNIYFRNCDAYNCCDSLTTLPVGNAQKGGDGYGFMNYNYTSLPSNVYHYNCRAWNCSDDGFQTVSWGYTEYDGCWSFNNGALDGAGNGYKLGLSEPTTATPIVQKLMKNCIAAYNKASGITTNDLSKVAKRMNVFNNTLYQNGFGFYIYNTTSSDADELKRVFRNNIIHANTTAYTVKESASYNCDHNSWNIPLTLTSADFESLDGTGLSAPRKMDGSLPDLNGFLKLKSTSKAVNAGINVGLPYSGTAPDLGYSEYSGTVTIPNQPPTISISSPSKNSSFISPPTIIIDAIAFDPDGTVTKVEFFNGNNKNGEVISLPYSFTWKDVNEGTYSVTATATDNSKAIASSAAITVIVNDVITGINQPPSINISSPGNNSSFQGPVTITLEVETSDIDGSIRKVEYFNRTSKIGESLTPPYSYSINCTSGGTYEITAVATDNLDGVTTSLPVVFEVTGNNNSDPINLYPTPNDGHFSIEFLSPSEYRTYYFVNIVNSLGKSVYRARLSGDENTIQFNLSYLPSGTYVLFITSSHSVVTTKTFIKN